MTQDLSIQAKVTADARQFVAAVDEAASELDKLKQSTAAATAELNRAGTASGLDEVGRSADAARAKVEALANASEGARRRGGDGRFVGSGGANDNAADAGPVVKAQEEARRAIALTGQQYAMLGYQAQDAAVQLAGGVNPLIVLLQQGSQVIPVFGGVTETLSALKAGIVALATPTNIAIAAVAALAAGLVAMAADAANAGARFATALDEQDERIKALRDAWGQAELAKVSYYNADAKRTAENDANRGEGLTREAAIAAARRAATEIQGVLRNIFDPGQAASAAERALAEQIKPAIDAFAEAAENGEVRAIALRRAISDLQVAAGNNSDLQGLLDTLRAGLDPLAESEARWEQQAAAIRTLTPAAVEARRVTGELSEAIRTLQSVAPSTTTELQKIEDAYRSGADQATSYSQVLVLLQERLAAFFRLGITPPEGATLDRAAKIRNAELMEERKRLLEEYHAPELKVLPTPNAKRDLTIGPLYEEKKAAEEASEAQRKLKASRDAAARAVASGEDRLELLRAELSLIGASQEERDRVIAQLRTEQMIRRDLVGATADQLALIREQSAAAAALEADLDRQRKVADEAASIQDRLVDGFGQLLNGMTGDWESLGDTALSVLRDIQSELIKLAILNPLKNWLFDAGLPELGDVVGKFFGGVSKASPAAAASAGIGSDFVAAANSAIMTPSPATASAAAPLAAGDFRPSSLKSAFLDAITSVESPGGRYDIRFNGSAGGATFDPMAGHPNIPSAIPWRPGLTSTAAGRYQMLYSTAKDLGYQPGMPFSPALQDDLAWKLAQQRTSRLTGGDLEGYLAKNGFDRRLSQQLAPTWEGLQSNSPKAMATFDRAVEGFSRNTGEAANAVKQLATSGNDATKTLANLAQQTVAPAASGTGTSTAAADVAASVQDQSQGIFEQIASMFSDLFSGLGDIIGSLVKGLFSWILHDGGEVGGGGSAGRMVPASTFARAPRLHGGAMVAAALAASMGGSNLALAHNERAAILEVGEVVATKEQQRSIRATLAAAGVTHVDGLPSDIARALVPTASEISVPRFHKGGVVEASGPVRLSGAGAGAGSNADSSSGNWIFEIHQYEQVPMKAEEAPPRDGQRVMRMEIGKAKKDIEAMMVTKYGLRQQAVRR